LQFEQIDAPLVLGFLSHLETARHIGPNSRNTRLAAIKSFMHFMEYRMPAAMEQINTVTAQREPLGVCDAWMWAREMRDADGVRAGQKESARRIEGYERVAEIAAWLVSTRLVYVADREGDMLVELMQRAKALNTPADWLVRARCAGPRRLFHRAARRPMRGARACGAVERDGTID
jgi:hypothetical protein